MFNFTGHHVKKFYNINKVALLVSEISKITVKKEYATPAPSNSETVKAQGGIFLKSPNSKLSINLNTLST